MKHAIRHAEVDEMLEEVSRAARTRGWIEGAATVISVLVILAFLTFPEWRSIVCL